MRMSPFSKFVRWMPRKKLRGPRSFNANSAPNFSITSETNLSEEDVITMSSTYTKKYIIILFSDKMKRDWSESLSLKPIEIKKSLRH